MKKYEIEYETYNPISGWRSERLTRVIESESSNNALAALGQKIDKSHCIDVYRCREQE